MDEIEGCHSVNLSLETSSTWAIQYNHFPSMLYMLVVLVLEKEGSSCYNATNRKQIFGGKLGWNKIILLNKNCNEVLTTEKLLMEKVMSSLKCPQFIDP